MTLEKNEYEVTVSDETKVTQSPPDPEYPYIDYIGRGFALEDSMNASNVWLIAEGYVDASGKPVKNFYAENVWQLPVLHDPPIPVNEGVTKERQERSENALVNAFVESKAEMAAEDELKQRFDRVYDKVYAENKRQIDKWGDQIGHSNGYWLSIFTEELGELCKELNDMTDIPGLNRQREFQTEMIQAIAVLCAWYDAYDRRMFNQNYLGV